MGLRLLFKRVPIGLNYFLTPVNIVRYFEFSFAFDNIPISAKTFLDVGSPRLFSLYMAKKYSSSVIHIINPDLNDIKESNTIVHALNLSNIHTYCSGVDTLSQSNVKYHCIWSISVIEHISNGYDDTVAVQLMYNSLANGGRLILTFPVDRQFHNEYRDHIYYRIGNSNSYGEDNTKYFFQRFYDKESIWQRILKPIKQEPKNIRWFGEINPGKFAQYERCWALKGHYCSVDDPREIVDNYREYENWEDMPGMGICGLVIQKA